MFHKEKNAEYFRQLLGEENVLINERMSLHTSFRVGGEADLFLAPASEEAFCKAVMACRSGGLPFFVLGNGSNLLVSDAGYRGVVIWTGNCCRELRVNQGQLYAGAGISLAKAAQAAKEASLTGLEFAGGIPGTVGGAVWMNAGAYGSEMKDVLSTVRLLDSNGEISLCPVRLMELSYRSSRLKKTGEIVLGADFSLVEGDREEIRKKMKLLMQKRQEKQPLDLPSAGSTFKRPDGYFAGKLIQDSGLAGFSIGGARVSEKHCGFIVNAKDASAQDIYQLIQEVRTRVQEKFGVELEPEIRFLGEF